MHNGVLAFYVGALLTRATKHDAVAHAMRQAPAARGARVARSVRAVIRSADNDPVRGPRYADPVAVENDYYRFRNQPRG
jgi:hypothetical protein